MFEKQIKEIIKRNKLFPKNSQVIIRDMGMGENNLNYLVIIDNNKYVFRIGIKKHLEKNMCKEFEFLKHIPKDLSPKPLFLDKTKKILPYYYSVLGYIEGKSVMVWNKEKLRLHAKAMAKLHSKKFNYWQTSGNTKERFSLYNKMIKDFKGYNKMTFTNNQKLLIKKFKSYIKENDHYFTELKKFYFIHGDLCADNILFDKNKIRYIDWEWCGIRDNAEDVARTYIIGKSINPWYVGLTDKEVNYLIKEYTKNIKDKTLIQRVEIWNNYMLFMDMIYFFWKIQNYNMFKSKLPKKHYVYASKILFKHFSDKFSL